MSVFKLRATGNGAAPLQRIDEGEVRRAFALLADPEALCQVVGNPGFRHANRKGDDLDGLVKAVKSFTDVRGIYFVLNPLSSALTIRDGLSSGSRVSTKDVLYRRWLFLDIDPIKPDEHKDNPASDAEHELTRQAAEETSNYLAEQGWPSPVIVDSGNGWYLIYRTYLPVSAHSQAIIRKWSRHLAERIKDKAVVDNKVHDAPRLAKVPGTLACKGKQSDDRPWRPCRLVWKPDNLEIVTAEMIVAATPEVDAPVASSYSTANGQTHTNGHAAKSPFVLKVGTDRAKAYWRTALDNECRKVAIARPPANGGEGRNNALYIGALKLGSLVGGGYGTRSEAESGLRNAARANGSYEDAGQGEYGVEATIRSGMETGISQPRIVTLPTPPKAAEGEGPKVEVGETLTIGANEVQPEPIDWLWYGRLPKGKLVTWAGQTGLGKSFLSCDIAARLSVGAEIPFGGGECFPKSGTLMLNCEDGYADTIVPRLIEAGADRRMIHFMKTDKLAAWTMAHLDALEKAIKETPDCRLVVLDAASSFLGGVDDHKNSEFRQLLAPFVLRVQEWGVCVVFVTHFNKAGSSKVEVLDRVMGGVAWVSGVRVAAAFIKTPTPEEPERRMCVPLKSNICRKQMALAYRLSNVDGDKDRCRVEWLEALDTTAEQAMAEALQGAHRPRGVIAAEWLIEQFNVRREWSSEDLFTAGKHAGISRNAIFEAKKQLDLPSARRMASENGDVTFIWWVPKDWPHLRVSLNPDEGEIPD